MNSVYGNFLQNNRNHMDVGICNGEGMFKNISILPCVKDIKY